MKISRYILKLCLACFIFSACTEAEIEKGPFPIQFVGSTNEVEVIHTSTTRAEGDNSDDAIIINNISDLKDKKISLYGIEYANTPTRSWNFMDRWEATVKESNSNYEFDYATVNGMQYYKVEGGLKYDFRAVFPAVDDANTNSGVTVSTKGFPYVDVKLEYRPDLMIAQADGKEKPNTATKIPLTFEHQLSLVTFNIYKDIESQQAGTESHNIYLNKMTLAGRTIADFNLETKELTIDVDGFSGATILVPGLVPGSPYSEFEIIEEPKKIRDLFLFPSDGDAVENKLKYTFEFTINERTYSTILPLAGKKWEAGLHYIYNIKVVGSDVYIEVGHEEDDDFKLCQEDWTDVDIDEPIEGK